MFPASVHTRARLHHKISARASVSARLSLRRVRRYRSRIFRGSPQHFASPRRFLPPADATHQEVLPGTSTQGLNRAIPKRDNMSVNYPPLARRIFLVGTLLGACHGTEASRKPEDEGQICLHEGEGDSSFDRIEQTTPCCPGLVRVRGYERTSMAIGQCLRSKGGRQTCTQCGNGQCGVGENFCSCPQDCKI